MERVKVRQPCIVFSLSLLNTVVSWDAPLNSWQEIDSVTELCLSLSVVDTHTHTHTHTRTYVHSHTHTHTKCWVTICECCISWPVLSWQADQTKCPICSLMAQVRWMRSSVVSSFFSHFCFSIFFFFFFFCTSSSSTSSRAALIHSALLRSD